MTNTVLGMILQLLLILLQQHLYLWLLWLNRLNYILLHRLVLQSATDSRHAFRVAMILECCRSNMASLHACLVTQSCLTLCHPVDCSPPSSSVHGDSPGKNTGVGCHALLHGIFPPGMESRSPVLQANSLLSEAPGKPKNAGVGSLSHLQGIFLFQESNWDLLHCRWILYQLSCQGILTLISQSSNT